MVHMGLPENEVPQKKVYIHVPIENVFFGGYNTGNNYRKTLVIDNHGINQIGI